MLAAIDLYSVVEAVVLYIETDELRFADNIVLSLLRCRSNFSFDRPLFVDFARAHDVSRYPNLFQELVTVEGLLFFFLRHGSAFLLFFLVLGHILLGCSVCSSNLLSHRSVNILLLLFMIASLHKALHSFNQCLDHPLFKYISI